MPERAGPEPVRQLHTIPPFWREDSEILILGSFPSVKSREAGFYYAHPQNRFWRVLASVFGEPAPSSLSEKHDLLLRRRIALWDAAASCEISGSSDSSIRAVRANEVASLVKASGVRRVLANGAAAARLYERHIFRQTGIRAVRLPSTSAANASWSLERLCAAWRAELLSGGGEP